MKYIILLLVLAGCCNEGKKKSWAEIELDMERSSNEREAREFKHCKGLCGDGLVKKPSPCECWPNGYIPELR